MSSPNQVKKPKLSTDDENKSFVGQMATTMTRLLPNTITKWFSTTPNANGSTQMAESTDSSTEDESSDGPLQPPAKRMRYNLPGPSSLYTIPETRSISTNTEPTESNDHSSVVNKSTYNLESNQTAKTCEETSAMLKKIEKSHYNLSDLAPSHQSSSGKRKSLDISASLSQLNESYDREFGVLNEHKPFFRIGLAASSPFYRGNTKYGGTNNLYINQPNIKSKKTTYINNSMNDNEATMSNSARRIMDLLDNFSSPTVEARRIPQITNTSMNNSNISMNTSTTTKRNLAFQNKELYVPSVASVLKLKERSRLMKTTSVARQIIASQSSSSGMYQASPVKSDNSNTSEGKFTSKIRSRVTKSNQNVTETEQTVIPVNLPTATLQIDKDNLPKFSFNISLPTASRPNHENDVPSSKTPEPNKNIVSSTELDLVPTQKHINIVAADVHDSTDCNSFKFSSPVRICVDTAEDPTSPQKFALCSPERNVEDIKQNRKSLFGGNKIRNLSPNTETTKIQMEKEQEKECKDIKKEQVQSDKSTDCDKVKQPKPLGVVVTATKWRCADCWVDNDEEKDKCVCCGGKKPSKTKSTDASNDKKDKDDQKSKASVVSDMSGSNKLNNAITSSNVTPSMPNSTLSHIVKQQSSKWECPNCMVRNENNTSKCVCCESEKPGTVKEVKNKSFNFGISPNVSFKFGIDPTQNIPPKENVKSADLQDKKSETNNNVFGNKIEFKSVETKSTEVSTKPAEPNKEPSDAPKTTFSFGIPKNNPVTTFAPTSSAPTPFSFGVSKPLDKPKTEHDDKAKDTPEKLLFGIKPTSNILSSITNNTLPILNKPFTPINTSTTTESVVPPQSTFSFSSNNFPPAAGLFDKQKSTTATETTTTLSNPIISSAQSPSSSMTFFSNTASASQQNPFFKKNETETSATLSLFPKSDSTTALFSKPESTTTTGLSLFSKPESTTTTATTTQPLASNSPLFSFGSNASQNVQQSAEKPKFSFAFGSNKTDTSKLFSAPPPFGSAVDKFNMSYPNTIGSGLSGNNGIGSTTVSNTTLNTNTLNSNVLANNTISSNIMGNNALGNNTLASNPIGGNILGNNPLGNSALGGNTVGNNTLNNNILSNNPMNNNELSNSNGLTTGNPLAGLACGNGLTAGTSIGGDSLSNTLNPANPLMVGSTSTSSIGGNIFNRAQKKDMWSGSSAGGGNIFASSATTSTVQKPASFTFGGSTSFNASSSTPAPAFGSAAAQPQPAQPAQGPPPGQPASNIFGNTSSNQPLFSNTVPNQPAQPSVFGSSQPAAPSMGLFGASGFGAPNASFENVAMNPTQAPAFNFGASNNQPSIFGFSQRPQMPQTSGVYNFGSPAGSSTPQVQFNMGSAPVAGRRVRKVIRRTTAR